jgi:adenosine deaminase
MTGRCQSLESHPVHSFIEASVPFVLCTDNPQVHGVSLSDEYRLFVTATGRHDLIEGMYDTQMKYAFG